MILAIESKTEFESLHEEWNELLHDSPSARFFLTHDWLHTWWAHLSGRRKLRILAVREDGRLVALAPLAVSPPSARFLLPMKRLDFLGTGIVGSDHLDLIVRNGWEERGLREMVDLLRSGRTMIHLSQVDEGASAVRRVTAAMASGGWRLAESSAGICPFIDLSRGSWEEYLAGRGREHRYAFRRKLKALSGRFEVRFEEVRSEDRRRLALALLMDLHLKRWKRKGESGAFHTPALRGFHDEISRRALERGSLRLQVLWLDGRPAAAIYGFLHDGVFSFYQSGFDPAFHPWSVGLVAMGLSIQSAIAEGAREYDLLHGAEKYKFHWADRSRELRRWDLFPPRGRGLVCQAMVALSVAARRGARRIVSLPRAIREARKARLLPAGD
jgi:CelD/BcsL family acetyltransferase involved in cellulose biosynthesis